VAINFPIVTTFDDKATKKADKAFGSLGRKFAAVFSVAAVVKFGKASVKAFQDGEKEAAQLRSQLEAINLGFASPLVNEYIDNLALLSGITGRDLTNAFISLSQATEDTTDAQDLLNVALDISAATGKSLQTVSVGLQRAYKGEVTALARLRIGLTTAELKGKDFNEVLEELRERFTGSSARAADTFAGKIARLKEAVDLAQEGFGKGLVSGIESSGQSIEDLQQDIIELGETLGSLTAGVNTFANDTIAAFDRIGNSSAVQGLLNIFEALVRGVGFVVTGELVPTMDQASSRLAAEERRKNEEANRATLRSRNELIRAEQKITRIKKEQGKLGDKEKKNALALAKARAVFDIEKIQIEAALQGKITEEERTRLLLMKAILAEDADTATKLADKLEKIQKQTVELAESLTNLKAGDPFSEWDGYFDAAKKNITDLFNTLAKQQTLLNELMSSIAVSRATANANVLAAKTDKASTFKEAAEASSVFAALSAADAVNAVAQAAAAVAAATTPEEKGAAQEAVEAANAYVDATSLLTESLAAADLAAALASLELANEYLNQSIEAATSQGIIPETTINVTVEGNVTSAEDLAEVITDIQYNYQRTGKGLLLSSRAI
jgi:hypothetical protein